MSTTYSTTDRAEKIQRLRQRADAAMGQALRWEELTPDERVDLDGEANYVRGALLGMGLDTAAEAVESIWDVIRLKTHARERGSALWVVLETMVRATDGLGLTAADLLPYAWEVVRDTEEGEDDER